MEHQGKNEDVRNAPVSSPELIAVRKAEIPEYLQVGAFFKSLGEPEGQDDSIIMVPGNVTKPDQRVTSLPDLEYLLSSLRFWGVDHLSLSDVVPFLFNLSEDVQEGTIGALSDYTENFPLLQVLLQLMPISNDEKVTSAMGLGSLDMLAYFETHQDTYSWPDNYSACQQAAVDGRDQVLLYILRRDGYLCKYTADKALCNDHAAAMMVAYENGGYDPNCADIVLACVQENAIKCLAYAHSVGLPLSAEHCVAAAECGNTECLRFLLDHGCEATVEAVNASIEDDYLACVQLLHERGAGWDDTTAATAARYGRLRILQYAHQQGCPWDSRVTVFAGEGGHLGCLQYAHENGCEVHADTMECVVMGGHLECLKYLVEVVGVPLDPDTCIHFAEQGKLECVKYAHAQGAPLVEDVTNVAVARGHIDVLEYLQTQGCVLNPLSCNLALERGQAASLQFAHEHGCALPDQEGVDAALNQFFEYLSKEQYGNYFMDWGHSQAEACLRYMQTVKQK